MEIDPFVMVAFMRGISATLFRLLGGFAHGLKDPEYRALGILVLFLLLVGPYSIHLPRAGTLSMPSTFRSPRLRLLVMAIYTQEHLLVKYLLASTFLPALARS